MNNMVELREKDMMMVDGGGFWGTFTAGFVYSGIDGAIAFSETGPGAIVGGLAFGIWGGGMAVLTAYTAFNF